MTCTLILMRHAKSDWNHEDLSDHDRPLNPRGRDGSTAMGNWLRARGHVPDAALVSSAARTTETFQRLGFDVPVQFTTDLYLKSSDVMIGVLRKATAPTVLLVGHNPGIGDMAWRLCATQPAHPRYADYPTCATLVVRFNVDSWTKVGGHSGQPLDFAVPGDVM
ncbi:MULTISPECIES: SixA phosphatase family protein [Roseobacteraceae]|jgi:phosphohistidine phosphatase|uniref:Phosphohistidine phosphatase n=1 Tax=Pseudosulfitobacter pseudonitzschiae TaxID=1402135 RepID=A0A221K310_9RHOB|nr:MULTISPECIES: histidine phosphatase family protein [Roseobacteraceae]ASM73365.1 phosphohistidine phosphatase [Pseudosulfitobacter pseudonitzschiae]